MSSVLCPDSLRWRHTGIADSSFMGVKARVYSLGFLTGISFYTGGLLVPLSISSDVAGEPLSSTSDGPSGSSAIFFSVSPTYSVVERPPTALSDDPPAFF